MPGTEKMLSNGQGPSALTLDSAHAMLRSSAYWGSRLSSLFSQALWDLGLSTAGQGAGWKGLIYGHPPQPPTSWLAQL